MGGAAYERPIKELRACGIAIKKIGGSLPIRKVN